MRVVPTLALVAVLATPATAQQRCIPASDEMPDRPVQSGPSSDEDDFVRYPESRRHVGDTGVVRLRFVVCANGVVDPASLVVIRASHEDFVPAAVWALARMRFTAATLRGVPVHQAVEMPLRIPPRELPTRRPQSRTATID